MSERNFLRRQQKRALVGAAIIVSAAVHEGMNNKPEDQVQQEQTQEVADPTTERSERARKPIIIEKGEELSDEDEERRSEHEDFRDRAMGDLAQALPEGFTASVIVQEKGKGVYDEYIQISGPRGEDYGNVYPDEGDGGHLIWFPSEKDTSLLAKYGIDHQPFELSTPSDITMVVDDVRATEEARAAEQALKDRWYGNELLTDENGTITMNPEYASAQQATSDHVRDVLSGLTYVVESEREEDVEEGQE